jgi:hypothetical protein
MMVLDFAYNSGTCVPLSGAGLRRDFLVLGILILSTTFRLLPFSQSVHLAQKRRAQLVPHRRRLHIRLLFELLFSVRPYI